MFEEEKTVERARERETGKECQRAEKRDARLLSEREKKRVREFQNV